MKVWSRFDLTHSQQQLRVTENHVKWIAQLVRHDRQKLILEAVRFFGGVTQLVLAREQPFAFFFHSLAFEVIRCLSRQEIHEAQLLFAGSMCITEMRGDDSEDFSSAAYQRQRLDREYVRLVHGMERRLTGKDLAVVDVFHDDTLFRLQRDTTRRISITNALEEL